MRVGNDENQERIGTRMKVGNKGEWSQNEGGWKLRKCRLGMMKVRMMP